jgi:hypothetical protein
MNRNTLDFEIEALAPGESKWRKVGGSGGTMVTNRGDLGEGLWERLSSREVKKTDGWCITYISFPTFGIITWIICHATWYTWLVFVRYIIKCWESSKSVIWNDIRVWEPDKWDRWICPFTLYAVWVAIWFSCWLLWCWLYAWQREVKEQKQQTRVEAKFKVAAGAAGGGGGLLGTIAAFATGYGQ